LIRQIRVLSINTFSLARFVNNSLPDTFILPQMNADELGVAFGHNQNLASALQNTKAPRLKGSQNLFSSIFDFM